MTRWFFWAALSAATAGASARQPTFRSGVDLVTVDAAVLDDDGRPVASLGAGDFRLEVDGHPRLITAAHFVSQAGSESASGDAVGVAAAEHFSSNEGADTGRVIVVAIDEAHIRRLEGRSALAAAAHFIDTLPAADRIGVVGLTRAGGVTLTRDRRSLQRRLESLAGNGDLMLQQLNLGLSEALEIADGNRSRLGDAVLRECGRALTEYVSTARTADDSTGRDACPEQVEQESRAIAQHAHLQARLSLTGLEALIDRLAPVPGPKTIVLVSEGMIVDLRRVDLSRLAGLAQAARVTIYGLQLEVPIFEAAQPRVSPTLVRDLQVRHDGVALVTAAARGAVFRQVGSDAKPFERIARELSGYYLIAFEAIAAERDGRAHRIRVTLAKGRGEVRARASFTMPAASPARGAELTSLLRNPSLATELPLRVATYCYAEPDDNRVRVVISAETGHRESPSSTSMGFVLVDASGVIAATATHESTDGRHSFSLAVPQGSYTLRVAASDTVGRQGSVERVFRAQVAGDQSLRVSDLMLALPAPPGVPLEPLVDRMTGPAIVAYLELKALRSEARPETVRVHISRAASEAPLVTVTADLWTRPGGLVIARASLPIATLPPGSYVARAEIVVAGVVSRRVRRPFTIAGQ
ncbi:MAG TPA: VWA domain-containing protein [Vicinamibacterales bacterium]|nr:VWA domain-containing protein [Vicinamibacterales bacterium]